MISKRIKTPYDIQSIDGYQDKVDQEKEEIAQFLKSYYVSPQIKCAICGQPHNDGFLFKTKKGATSNMGKDCYTKFRNGAEKLQEFHDEISVKHHQQTIGNFKRYELPNFRREVNQLFEQQTALRRRIGLFKANLPRLTDMLAKRGMNNDTRVYVERDRTEKEIENYRELHPTASREEASIERKLLGYLTGLSIFRLYLGNEMVLNELAELEGESLVTMSKKKLKEWSRWVENNQDWLKDAKTSINTAHLFFTESNLELFKVLRVPELELVTLNASTLDSFGVKDDDNNMAAPEQVKEPEPAQAIAKNPHKQSKQQQPIQMNRKTTLAMKYIYGRCSDGNVKQQ